MVKWMGVTNPRRRGQRTCKEEQQPRLRQPHHQASLSSSPTQCRAKGLTLGRTCPRGGANPATRFPCNHHTDNSNHTGFLLLDSLEAADPIAFLDAPHRSGPAQATPCTSRQPEGPAGSTGVPPALTLPRASCSPALPLPQSPWCNPTEGGFANLPPPWLPHRKQQSPTAHPSHADPTFENPNRKQTWFF